MSEIRYREYPDEIAHEDPATYEKFAEPEGEDET